MRCIAIDDEPIALSIVRSYCDYDPTIELTTYSNPLEGIRAIEQIRPDIVFLDIEMNDYSGLELARDLPDSTILIFTTAHAGYAMDGYEVNAIDFLHKPFSFERFESAISRAKQLLEVRAKAKLADSAVGNQITIKVEYQNVTISLLDVLYVESMDNYIKIYMCDKRTILTKMSIKCLMEFLPSDEFLRIHRSYVVAKRHIASFTKQRVRLSNSTRVSLPVGRIYGEQLFRAMVEM